MSNAVIYMNPEAYRTSVDHLMGRHSAGESFLKGFLQHAAVPDFHLWNIANRPVDELETLVKSLKPADKPINWIQRNNRVAFAEVGAVHIPSPQTAREAWSRRALGPARYSITGVTHTTATSRIMDAVAELIYAPIEPWDALICTSRAVRDSLDVQIAAVREYLATRLDAREVPTPQLTTIPLGINVKDFSPPARKRREWREKLGIPEDALVILYVGRLNYTSKMSPAPMAIALERLAKQIKQPVHWILSGWAANETVEKHYHEETRSACPSVGYHPVDGREPDTRRSIWAAADIFLSLSDNLQETFGLTPLEGMAAGLPVVVSDWDGYRDTVRHEIDGFRVATYTPAPGRGADFAYRHANEWDHYDIYVGSAAQATAVDLDETVRALLSLAASPDLRKRMGQSGRERARSTYEWSVIIPQYQRLWTELERRRSAAEGPSTRPSMNNPWRMDPFRLFAGYPTEFVSYHTMIAKAPGEAPWKTGAALLDSPLVRYARPFLPSAEELEQIGAALSRRRQLSMGQLLASFPNRRRQFIERGVLLMAKYGQVLIFPSAGLLPD